MEQPRQTLEQFVTKTLRLLEKERETEIEETRLLTDKLPPKELQRRGVCLLKLHIGSRKTGLYGRTVVALETHLDALPAHSITPGDIVELNHSSSDRSSDALGSGIVTRVSQSAVSVAFDHTHDLYSLDDGQSDYYKLTKLANDVTYKRLKRTLGDLNKVQHDDTANLKAVLFGEQQLSSPYNLQDFRFINTSLDESQQDAVRFALCQREVGVVHGPPGTGKTTTVIEIILQAVRQGNKILACAPSNIAVDNLVERLSGFKHRIVRLGHPARLLPHVQKYSLDAILSTSDETRLVEDVRRDLDTTLSKLKKARNAGEKQKMREDMKYLRKELRQRENTATRDILHRADVVLVTLTSATDDGPMKLVEETHFDIAVIDEVSQAVEAACWIPLLRARKCVLAGDHLQLPPTILSKEAAKDGLAFTLMERVLDLHGDSVMKMLTTQYRMNEKIMQWSSDTLYDSRLVAHESVKHHLLKDLPGIEEDDLTDVPLLFIDTAGCDMLELELPEEISKGNEGEADIVAMHVNKLINSGMKPEDIAVIAPYNLQVELIRLRLTQQHPKVEVKSVDGFQGREKEAVVISLVRSNTKGEVGFLSERRRINVAVTRARRHLTVVGDSETVSHDEFLRSLIDYLNQAGEVETAQQYIDGGLMNKSSVERPEHLADLMTHAKVKDKGARPKVPRVGKPEKSANTLRKMAEDSRQPRKTDIPVLEDETNEPKICELQTELDGFMQNAGADVLEFPATLNSHDRLLVHELAEKMGLTHASKGIGNDRHIVVRKASKRSQDHNTEGSTAESVNRTEDGKQQKNSRSKRKDNKCTKYESDKSSDKVVTTIDKNENMESKLDDSREIVQSEVTVEMDEVNGEVVTVKADDVIEVKRDSNKVECKLCGKDVLKANIQLHEIHCGRQSTSRQNVTDKGATNKQKGQKVNSSKPRQFDKELAKRVNAVDGDDIDALVEAVKKMDNFCCFKKCKKSVQTLCNVCNFCKGRYCMSHQIPEVHGCGDAARQEARARISKDGVLYRGSGQPNKRPDSAKKAHLHRRLESKLTDLADKRKSKPKKQEKGSST